MQVFRACVLALALLGAAYPAAAGAQSKTSPQAKAAPASTRVRMFEGVG